MIAADVDHIQCILMIEASLIRYKKTRPLYKHQDANPPIGPKQNATELCQNLLLPRWAYSEIILDWTGISSSLVNSGMDDRQRPPSPRGVGHGSGGGAGHLYLSRA